MAVRDVQPMFMSPAQKQAGDHRDRQAGSHDSGAEAADPGRPLTMPRAGPGPRCGRLAGSIHPRRLTPDRAEARLADALDRPWTPVAAGMADGVVSIAQAQVVVHALEALPDDLDPGLVAEAEAKMVTYCQEFRPSELRRLGRHLLEVIGPEIAEAELAKQLENEEQRAREKTTLRSKNIGEGMARTTITHPVPDRDRLFTYPRILHQPPQGSRRDQRRGGPDPLPQPPRPSLRRTPGTPRPRQAPRTTAVTRPR